MSCSSIRILLRGIYSKLRLMSCELFIRFLRYLKTLLNISSDLFILIYRNKFRNYLDLSQCLRILSLILKSIDLFYISLKLYYLFSLRI